MTDLTNVTNHVLFGIAVTTKSMLLNRVARAYVSDVKWDCISAQMKAIHEEINRRGLDYVSFG